MIPFDSVFFFSTMELSVFLFRKLQKSGLYHSPAKGIQLGSGQFGRLGLLVFPTVTCGVAEPNLPGQVFLAKGKLSSNFLYQCGIIRIYGCYQRFLKDP